MKFLPSETCAAQPLLTEAKKERIDYLNRVQSVRKWRRRRRCLRLRAALFGRAKHIPKPANR